jgi:hypothetical protein
LAALAAQVETDAKAAMVAQAIAQGKAVTLAQSVLDKMDRGEVASYLSALPRTLPVASALPRSNREAPAATPRAAGLALVDAKRRTGLPFERAWRAARAERPDLF